MHINHVSIHIAHAICASKTAIFLWIIWNASPMSVHVAALWHWLWDQTSASIPWVMFFFLLKTWLRGANHGGLWLTLPLVWRHIRNHIKVKLKPSILNLIWQQRPSLQGIHYGNQWNFSRLFEMWILCIFIQNGKAGFVCLVYSHEM